MHRYNLFISHSWTYSNAYQGLLALLDAKLYFFYKNHSVPENDPVHTSSDRVLYEAITRKISGTHAVLVFAALYANYWFICTRKSTLQRKVSMSRNR